MRKWSHEVVTHTVNGHRLDTLQLSEASVQFQLERMNRVPLVSSITVTERESRAVRIYSRNPSGQLVLASSK